MNVVNQSRLEIAGVSYVPAARVTELLEVLAGVVKVAEPETLAWHVAKMAVDKYQGEQA